MEGRIEGGGGRFLLLPITVFAAARTVMRPPEAWEVEIPVTAAPSRSCRMREVLKKREQR